MSETEQGHKFFKKKKPKKNLDKNRIRGGHKQMNAPKEIYKQTVHPEEVTRIESAELRSNAWFKLLVVVLIAIIATPITYLFLTHGGISSNKDLSIISIFLYMIPLTVPMGGLILIMFVILKQYQRAAEVERDYIHKELLKEYFTYFKNELKSMDVGLKNFFLREFIQVIVRDSSCPTKRDHEDNEFMPINELIKLLNNILKKDPSLLFKLRLWETNYHHHSHKKSNSDKQRKGGRGSRFNN